MTSFCLCWSSWRADLCEFVFSACGHRGDWSLNVLWVASLWCGSWAGGSAAVYLAAYLLVFSVSAAAACGDGVSLHVVSGFLKLRGFCRATSVLCLRRDLTKGMSAVERNDSLLHTRYLKLKLCLIADPEITSDLNICLNITQCKVRECIQICFKLVIKVTVAGKPVVYRQSWHVGKLSERSAAAYSQTQWGILSHKKMVWVPVREIFLQWLIFVRRLSSFAESLTL